MKNEIDEILDGLFAQSNEIGKSKAAQEAEAFLESLNNKQKTTSDDLNLKLDELEKINNSAKKQLNQINRHLNMDGFDVETEDEEKIIRDNDIIFKEVLAKTNEVVIGQNEFVRKLNLAFKRPLITGYEKGKACSVIVVNGKTGTGRHSALNHFTHNLANEAIIKGETPSLIDLSLYPSQGESKLFIQDIFSAIHSQNDVIVFENFEKCHRSILNEVIDLAVDGKIQLDSRYAEQKGMLIEVGNSLVKDAMSSINCDGKYLVFLTDLPKSKLADKLGSSFISKVKDFCTTSEFSQENIELISKDIINKLCEKSLGKLNFILEYNEVIVKFFADKFTLIHGINSIEAFADKCFILLSEYKLENDVSKITFNTAVASGILEFICGDIKIKIEEVHEDNEALDAVKGQIDEIIGLKEVKDYIFALDDNFKMRKIRGEMGLKTQSLSMHMIFTGNPGTGKTSIARLVSRYLKAIGVLTGGQLIEVTRADLVGKYVGHTAPLTRQIIDSAIGGVLFIDEAYSLSRGEDDSFGLEAIDTLVKCMEDNRENLIVILAGYTKEMNDFLKSNSGLVSRFPNIIEFQDYTARELYAITMLMAKNKGYKIADEMEEIFLSYYDKVQQESSVSSGNGRLARNILESAILNQSKRIIADGKGNYEELTTADFDI